MMVSLAKIDKVNHFWNRFNCALDKWALEKEWRREGEYMTLPLILFKAYFSLLPKFIFFLSWDKFSVWKIFTDSLNYGASVLWYFARSVFSVWHQFHYHTLNLDSNLQIFLHFFNVRQGLYLSIFPPIQTRLWPEIWVRRIFWPSWIIF